MGGLRDGEGLDDPREVAELARDVLAAGGEGGDLGPSALEHDAGLLADAVGVGPRVLGHPDQLGASGLAALVALTLQPLDLGRGALAHQPCAALRVLEAALRPSGDRRLALARCRQDPLRGLGGLQLAAGSGALRGLQDGLCLGPEPFALGARGGELGTGPV